MLENIGLNDVHRAMIIGDGFGSMKDLVDHYKVTGLKEFETYLKDLNKTFDTATANSNLRVYYSPKIIKRLLPGVL